MKLFNKINLFFISASSLLLTLVSCEKNDLRLQETADPSTGAYFKLGWFSPAVNTQGIQLKINNQRLSNQLGYGFTGTSNYAMPFPGGGLNTGGNNKSDYLSVPVGDLEVVLSVPKKGTNEDSIVVLKTNVNVELGKSYTMMVTDSFPNAQSYFLNDNATYADSGSIKLKFTNAIPNVGGNLDFLRSNKTTGINQVVAPDVAFKAATDYLVLPYITGADTIKIRKTGTTTILGFYTTSSIQNRRAYTVVARGYAGTTVTRLKPEVSIIYNK